jgi:serine/threonine protein kinase
MDSDFIIKRFRQERQILAELNHPNIARLLDGGTTQDGSPYLIMEFVEGDTLLEYSEKNHLTVEERLRLFEQICRAVEYAHRQNVLHRDLKPSNILVARDGTPKLLDFGIAKLHDAEENQEHTELTMTGKWLMTPEYASPEQVRGEPLTPASDVYSLGIVLYNLVTGEPPYKFPSRAPHDISRVICEVTPAAPLPIISRQLLKTESSNGLPYILKNRQSTKDDSLERIILKSLRKNPLDRYQSSREFAEDIAHYLKGEFIAAPEYQRETAASAKKTKKTSRWRAAGQGALLILLGFFVVAIVAMIDSAFDLLMRDEVPALIFMVFFTAGLWRIVYSVYSNE